MKKNEDYILTDDELRYNTDIAFNQILMRHVDRIGLLSAKGLSIIKSVKILQYLLKPYHDKKFNELISKLDVKKDDEDLNIKSAIQTGRQVTSGVNIEEYYIEIFGGLMELMDRKDLLIKGVMTSMEGVDDESDKEDLVE